jgi:monofunctional biosynthetic peptidoglycan transglycosylase
MATSTNADGRELNKRRGSVPGRIARVFVLAMIAFYAWVASSLLLLRWVNPPTTAVQIQRRLESWMHRKTYRKVYSFVPIDQIAPPCSMQS